MTLDFFPSAPCMVIIFRDMYPKQLTGLNAGKHTYNKWSVSVPGYTFLAISHVAGKSFYWESIYYGAAQDVEAKNWAFAGCCVYYPKLCILLD